MAPFFSEPSQTGMGRQISSLLSELFADRWLGLSGVTLIRIIATVDMEMDPVEMEFLYRSCEKVYVTTYVSKECAGKNVQKHFTPHAPDAYLQTFLLEVFRPWDICIWLARSSKKRPSRSTAWRCLALRQTVWKTKWHTEAEDFQDLREDDDVPDWDLRRRKLKIAAAVGIATHLGLCNGG